MSESAFGFHECRQTENPRHAGRCACGKPVAPTTRPRNLQFERDTIEHAAKGVVDPEPIIEHAETRIAQAALNHGKDPAVVRLGVNWLHELSEELLDGSNYAVWWLEEHLDDPDLGKLEAALRHLVIAYELVREVRER